MKARPRQYQPWGKIEVKLARCPARNVLVPLDVCHACPQEKDCRPVEVTQ